MGPKKIIIDTDPGIDDIHALLLGLSASNADVDIQLISLTHGNIDVHSCLRNVVSLFHTIDLERKWRQQSGRDIGFDALFKARQKPVVAIGADRPLQEQLIMADFFHGKDGLGGIHDSHPHLSPPGAWKSLFNLHTAEAGDVADAPALAVAEDYLFKASPKPAQEAILDVLRENEQQTVTIVALGPLTNLALAAASDPATFLRAAEVVVMGGALREPGNITPLAEFNTHADAVAAARIYALTSPTPSSTMPPTPPENIATRASAHSVLPPYPSPLPGLPLTLTLFPLDITERHLLHPEAYDAATREIRERGGPLARWTTAFMPHAFRKSMAHGSAGLAVHDAVCIWYVISGGASADRTYWHTADNQDVRVETTGQWTRGSCITDGRPSRGRNDVDPATLVDGEASGDRGGWRDSRRGNRLRVCTETPGGAAFEQLLLSQVYGTS